MSERADGKEKNCSEVERKHVSASFKSERRVRSRGRGGEKGRRSVELERV